MANRRKISVRLGTRAFALAALLGGALSSCGGKVATGHPDVLGADFVTDAAEAACANFGHCCSAQSLPFDEARCRQAIASALSGVDWTVVQGPISGTGKCIDALTASAQTCIASPSGCNDAIGSVIAIRKQRGEPCDSNCTQVPDEGTACEPANSGAPASVGLPQGCFTNDNLYCDATNTCVARVSFVAEGASCFVIGGPRCESGLYCATSSGRCSSTPSNGPPCHCVKLKGAGEHCDSQLHDCASGECTNGTCPPPPPSAESDLSSLCL
jgi:hypothetical protein